MDHDNNINNNQPLPQQQQLWTKWVPMEHDLYEVYQLLNLCAIQKLDEFCCSPLKKYNIG